MAGPQICGFLMGCAGWLCVLVATSTNNWVVLCNYGTATCKKSEQSKTKGPWAECSVTAAHYECQPLTQILELPAYIHTTRALMITACTVALLAVVLLLMSLPCISLDEPPRDKSRRAALGGLGFLFVGLCSTVSTVWFPIGVHHEQDLRSFGYSLYVGWAGAVLTLLGGLLIVCCSLASSSSSSSSSSSPSSQYNHNNDRFYYTKQGGGAHHHHHHHQQQQQQPPATVAVGNAGATATSHAKTAHV